MALRGLKPAPVESFGGYNPTIDSTELGWAGAESVLNVEIEPGYVRTRHGSTLLGTAAMLSDDAYVLSPTSYSGTGYLLALCSNTTNRVYLDRVAQDGTVTAVGNWATSSLFTSVAHIGTPSASLSFIASWSATLRKYTGAALSTSVGAPIFVCVTPVSNRLVQAGFSAAADSPTGTNGSQSTVFFSDAGAPETFSSNNFVDLHPGDGEVITGVVAWRDLTFVFKSTKTFVFYGESTDTTGRPVFNYRSVHCQPVHNTTYTATPIAAAGKNGVYLLCNDGLYVSSGGEFRKVSTQIDAVFDAMTESATVYGVSAAAGLVFVSVVDSSVNSVYVLDEASGIWTVWRFAATVFTPFVEWPAIQPYGRSVFYGSGESVMYTDPASTSDNGTAIAAHYQSGWFPPGGPGVEATVRQTELVGTGSPLFAWARDFGAFDTATAVTLGTSPAVARGLHRVAKRGENLAFKISSTSGAWAVRRVVPMLRDARGLGERTS